jgi:hypothetical protein
VGDCGCFRSVRQGLRPPFGTHDKKNTVKEKSLQIISTNNIARGMVRDGRKYAFNSPKIRFLCYNTKYPKRFLYHNKAHLRDTRLPPPSPTSRSSSLSPDWIADDGSARCAVRTEDHMLHEVRVGSPSWLQGFRQRQAVDGLGSPPGLPADSASRYAVH